MLSMSEFKLNNWVIIIITEHFFIYTTAIVVPLITDLNYNTISKHIV